MASTLQITTPDKSYNAAVGPNWRGTVLDMSPNGGPAGAHEIEIPVPVLSDYDRRRGQTLTVTLGGVVTTSVGSYRPLTVTTLEGARVYNLPTTSDLMPQLHLASPNSSGSIQGVPPLFPRCRVADISAFTFTS
jgi:hypothetical protein